jgi:RluA family pseudouridine synthase
MAALRSGKVYVNGKRATAAGAPLKAGTAVDIYIDHADLAAAAAPEPEVPSVLRILYEDEALICFDKPAGLPTHATVDGKRANLYDLARKQLGGAYLGLHHRLDRDTSGVLLFTKETKYNKFVAEQFTEHKLLKSYTALVHGVMPRPEGRLESFLGSLGRSGAKRIQKFGTVKSGGKKAITDYQFLEKGGGFSLVECVLHTGRTHQIRVHLSEQNHSIVGDTLYGSPERYYNRLGRHMLHAHAMTISHPVTNNAVRIESPVPPVFRELLEGK